jgi:hypothetical protein
VRAGPIGLDKGPWGLMSPTMDISLESTVTSMDGNGIGRMMLLGPKVPPPPMLTLAIAFDPQFFEVGLRLQGVRGLLYVK